MRSVLATLVVVLAGCPARYVAQDAHTGSDGESIGAERLFWQRGRARSRGEVSFPGGDRVDWKYVDAPRSRTTDGASIHVWLQWKGAGDVSFTVYDTTGNQLGEGADPHDLAMGWASRSADLYIAGPVFIRVQAVGPSDAGKYELRVTYGPPIDWKDLDVPEPPPLGAVPLPYCEGIQVPERDPCQWWPRCDTREDLHSDNPNCKWYFDSHVGKP